MVFRIRETFRIRNTSAASSFTVTMAATLGWTACELPIAGHGPGHVCSAGPRPAYSVPPRPVGDLKRRIDMMKRGSGNTRNVEKLPARSQVFLL